MLWVTQRNQKKINRPVIGKSSVKVVGSRNQLQFSEAVRSQSYRTHVIFVRLCGAVAVFITNYFVRQKYRELLIRSI